MDVQKIRQDFPVLQKQLNGKPIIYFDSACMSLKPRPVINAMLDYYENYPACAGRSAHRFSNKTNEEYNRARERIARFIHAKPEEVVFTRNTTEGINLIAHSLSFKQGDIVISSDREHNSNLLPWQRLAARGVRHRIVKSKKDFSFDMEEFKGMLSKSVRLVSVVHTSNIDGYTLPVKEIIKIAHDHDALVLLDGAQSVPHMGIDVKKLDADFLAFSGHKMLGPTGTGVLYGKSHLLEKISPFMLGGDTIRNSTYNSYELLPPPEKFEAGLQNYAGMIGLGAAADYLGRIGMDNIHKQEKELTKTIADELEGIGGIRFIGHRPEGGVISFSIAGIHFHDIAVMLDELANIMIRSGQHCVHSWFHANGIEGSARASLYLYNTKEEAKIFIEKIKEIIKLK